MNFTDYTDCSVVLAVELVNTLDVISGEDALSTADDLRRLLDDAEVSGVRAVTPDDVEAVRRLRSRLRGIFETTDERAAVAELNRLIATAGALPQLTDHDGEAWHLHFAAPDVALVDRLAAETAIGLAIVIRDHGFPRLRVCASERCADVFVDATRNRSRRYCTPEVCGNRAHVAAYRARRRASAPADA